MAINLLAGLEKFGIGGKEAFDITGDDGGKKKKEHARYVTRTSLRSWSRAARLKGLNPITT